MRSDLWKVGLVLSMACGPAFPGAALAESASWLAGPVDAQFANGSNWSTGNVPNEAATFGSSSITSIVVDGNVELDTLNFTAMASPYQFEIAPLSGLYLTGGINSLSQASPGFSNNFSFFFYGGSAGNATIVNNRDAFLLFQNDSSAGTALIENRQGFTSFQATSTAGLARILNGASGLTQFFDASNAGSATVQNDAQGGTEFYGSSSAANAVITNNARGDTVFMGESSAGNATLVNNARGTTSFENASTAGNATIVNNAGGSTFFKDLSTADNATIVNNAGGRVDISGLTGSGITIGTLSGAGDVVLGRKTLTLGGSGDATISGTIQDGRRRRGGVGGALVKQGAGTLTLSGSNTYTGPTTVREGTLVVNGSTATSRLTTVASGATLGGTGTVGTTQISSGGVLAPGAAGATGTMTVAGNLTFASGSVYAVRVTPGTASATTVTGRANLGGAMLVASFAPGTYYSRSYTLLSAAGGRSGSFGIGTVGLPQGFSSTLSYTPTDVLLGLTANLGGGQGLTPNQSGVANAINNAFNGGATVPSGLQALFSMPGGSLPSALNSLTGEAQTGAPSAGFAFGGQFLNTVMGGAASGRRNGGGAAGGGASPANGAGGLGSRAPSDGARPVQHAALGTAESDACEAVACADPRRLHGWIEGFGGYGWLGGTATTQALQTSARGIAVGVAWALDEGTLGVTVAGGGSNWFLGNGLGGGQSSNVQIGLYGTTDLGPLYLAGVAAWGQQMVNSQRPVSFLGDWLTANYTASTWSGRLETGHRFAMGEHALTPFLAGQGIMVSTPGFCEASMTGTGASLCFGGGNSSSIRSELGLEGETDLGSVWGSKARLVGRLAWAHEYQTAVAATAWFQALPGAAFTVTGAQLPSDIAVGRVLSTFELDGSWSLRLQADAELANSYFSVAGTIRLSARW